MTEIRDAIRSSAGREHIPTNTCPAFDLLRQNVSASKQDFRKVTLSRLAQGFGSLSSF